MDFHYFHIHPGDDCYDIDDDNVGDDDDVDDVVDDDDVDEDGHLAPGKVDQVGLLITKQVHKNLDL